ncbi:unnamed protein product [Didymodactylos carnosus]|uniref:Uncharacterized protein n=1 Tax=Didymodactylos carnosus TaxID=1234261 RepID=A0A815YUX3_9BILA|nr:unnamed protein product [Didymodactylos carnosus]CAF4441771.1 unnamed protein product [Didymodactylos carnosus]
MKYTMHLSLLLIAIEFCFINAASINKQQKPSEKHADVTGQPPLHHSNNTMPRPPHHGNQTGSDHHGNNMGSDHPSPSKNGASEGPNHHPTGTPPPHRQTASAAHRGKRAKQTPPSFRSGGAKGQGVGTPPPPRGNETRHDSPLMNPGDRTHSGTPGPLNGKGKQAGGFSQNIKSKRS